MSLLITSNRSEEYAHNDPTFPINHIPADIGIQQPENYRNHLRDPMKILPNSEIAVQSLRFTRNATIDVTDGDLFYVYLGLCLQSGTGEGVDTRRIHDTTSVPIPCRVPSGKYTSEDLCDALQVVLKESVAHPNYWQNVVVEIKRGTTSDAFEGFCFTFDCLAKTDGTDYGDKLETWQGLTTETQNDDSAYTITNNVGSSGTHPAKSTTITRTKATNPVGSSIGQNDCSVVCTDAPMDLVNGEIEVDLFQYAMEEQGIGGVVQCSFFLTKPELPDETPLYLKGSHMANQDSQWGPQPIADYQVSWEDRDGTGHKLYIYQLVAGHPWRFDGDYFMKEIEYWGTDNAKGPTRYGSGDRNDAVPPITQVDFDDMTTSTSGGTAGYKGTFQVKFIGEGIRVSIRNYDSYPGQPLTWKVLCDTTSNVEANRSQHLKCFTPINQNKWALYLGVSTNHLNHEINVDKMCWIDDLRTSTTTPYLYGSSSVQGSSFYQLNRHKYKTSNHGGEKLIGHPLFRQNQAQTIDAFYGAGGNDGTGYAWIDLDADTSVSVAYTRALTLADPGFPCDDEEEVGEYIPACGANMSLKLGFPHQTYVVSNNMGDTYRHNTTTAETDPAPKWVVCSTDVGDNGMHVFGGNSLFVKVPSITAGSYNWCKSMPSQILYHCPTWTPDGRAYGQMFFEVHEKTYIRLNNTETININQFDVQLVDKWERLAEDLTGTTIIVFHIRPCMPHGGNSKNTQQYSTYPIAGANTELDPRTPSAL